MAETKINAEKGNPAASRGVTKSVGIALTANAQKQINLLRLLVFSLYQRGFSQKRLDTETGNAEVFTPSEKAIFADLSS